MVYEPSKFDYFLDKRFISCGLGYVLACFLLLTAIKFVKFKLTFYIS
ncbi:hypothetical protein CAMSH0001_0773 [Campylobacter showae RM3277]|uniref:Uncharacterized protein n=1 Tax=Campylobacter showae RM3277 TaxID=553219 RepID=C6RHE6_9BACT|nr:hypothetical protein CAMSH0001_0773 [Campylobacter showae RM3277]